MVWTWKRSAYRVFIGKHEGRSLFGGPRGIGEGNFKMEFKEAEWEGVV
jgi:hypothetical protein